MLIGNQRYQVTPFVYINQADKVSHLVRRRKVIKDMEYLTRSFKRGAEAIGIRTEENWNVKRMNLLYIVVHGGFNFKINKRFDSLTWS